MILQDNDPHHLHPDFSTFYYFLIIAVFLLPLVIYTTLKIADYLEKRRKSKRSERESDE